MVAGESAASTVARLVHCVLFSALFFSCDDGVDEDVGAVGPSFATDELSGDDGEGACSPDSLVAGVCSTPTMTRCGPGMGPLSESKRYLPATMAVLAAGPR